jgi:hypothetical protein
MIKSLDMAMGVSWTKNGFDKVAPSVFSEGNNPEDQNDWNPVRAEMTAQQGLVDQSR